MYGKLLVFLDYFDRLKNKRYFFVVESKKLLVFGELGCKKRVSVIGMFLMLCRFSLIGLMFMDVEFLLSDLEEFEVSSY